MDKRRCSSLVENNLISIKERLAQLADSSSQIPAIPLAPPPSLDFDEEEREYERQGAIPKQQRGSINRKRPGGRKLPASNNIYNRIDFENSNSRIKSSRDSIELVGFASDGNKCEMKKPTNDNEQKQRPRHHHIEYFSSDLTLSNEERMQLVCDEYSECKFSLI